MIPAATTILHAEPTHSCAGCRNLATMRCTPMGCDLARQPVGIDGCSVPTWAIPLRNLALGFARLPSRPAGQR